MDNAHLGIGLLALGGIATIGAGSLFWAYKGAGSVAVLFPEVMPAPPDLPDPVHYLFQTGVSAYCAGNYRRALDAFNQVLQTQADLAEAYHDRGLCLANLRQDDQATRSFVKAAELYLVQDDRPSAELVKQHLRALKQRKQAK
ncbi:hypothetical protein [Alkalinema sp. FACHB-956]|uniref:hypothetical protein n=1 Tax=Alkalinema sp. FACHB-956 TaxID=2692768 RepID=UPI0016864EB8|nr:hypothetical protein [Alkalinema sp. FACHB-956]MBD2327695.1 hypothetical protein [Alkalinema sp. FACHB-956]